MTDLLRDNTGEGFKGAVHLAAFGLSFAMLAYNLGAALTRPTHDDRALRLWLNVVVYGLGTIYEGTQTHYHWSDTA